MISLALAITVAAGAGEAASARCLRAHTSIRAGAAAISADFSPSPCPRDAPMPAFRHDAARGGSVVSRPLAEDEIVRAFPDYGVAMVQPGERLRVVLGIGAVRIGRDVEALQTARPGQRLFVRTSDGQILSVRYEASP